MEINLNINSSLKKMLSGLNSDEVNKIIADSIITEAELDKLSKSKDVDRNVVLCAKAIAQNGTSDASKNNELCNSLKDFFANPNVQKIIDSSGDGSIDDKELSTYFSSIKGLDKNSSSLSVSDLNLALSSLNPLTTPPAGPDSGDDGGDKKLKEKLVEAGKNLDTAWGDLKNSEKDMNTAVNKELQNNQDLAQYKTSYETVQTNITNTNKSIDDTKDSIKTKNEEIDTAVGKIEETKANIATNAQSQNDVKLEIQGIGTQIDGLNAQISAINAEPEEIDPKTNKPKSTKQGRISSLNNKIDHLERQAQIKQEKLDSLVSTQKDLEKQQKEHETNLDILRSDLKDLETALDDYNEARDGYVKERDTILSNIQKCKTVSQETKDVIDSYRDVQGTYDSAKNKYDSAKKAYDATIKFTYIPKEKRRQDSGKPPLE